ncbi:MAG: DUF2905 family protein [Verrucomicrobiales bacterium]
MRTIIIVLAVVLLLIGLFWPVLSKVPLFRLPGDLVIERPGVKIYFPLTSMLILSLLLMLLLRFLR